MDVMVGDREEGRRRASSFNFGEKFNRVCPNFSLMSSPLPTSRFDTSRTNFYFYKKIKKGLSGGISLFHIYVKLGLVNIIYRFQPRKKKGKGKRNLGNKDMIKRGRR